MIVQNTWAKQITE